MAIFQCSVARSSAIPRPMPFAPPVMSATRSVIGDPPASRILSSLESGCEQLQRTGCSHGKGPVLFGLLMVLPAFGDELLQVCNPIHVAPSGGQSDGQTQRLGLLLCGGEDLVCRPGYSGKKILCRPCEADEVVTPIKSWP